MFDESFFFNFVNIFGIICNVLFEDDIKNLNLSYCLIVIVRFFLWYGIWFVNMSVGGRIIDKFLM